MVRRLGTLSVVALLATTASAQFGIPNRKKGGGSFEEMNEMAKQQQDGAGAGAAGGLAGMPNLEGMDMESIQKMMEEAMKDPSLAAMNANMAEAMEQLGKMTPEELQAQMMEGLQQLTSGDIMDSVLGKKDEVLETLAAQGLVPAEKIAEYRANPAKFEEEMKDAFGQMQKVFEDPEMLSAATNMMKGMGEMMQNPDAALKQLSASMDDILGDDTKIEEARLQLLKDPDSAGNPMLAELFKNEDMKEILYDSEKWKAAVKEGKGMLLNDGAAAVGGGARVGEL